MIYNPNIKDRFRGYLPVVVDVETGGFNAKKDALLEIAAVVIAQDHIGRLFPAETFSYHVIPFPGSSINPEALEFNGIDPFSPFRQAIEEKMALTGLCDSIRAAAKASECKKSILVGHNASFDLNFVNEAVARNNYKRNPFHPFSTFDTVTLSGLAFGQTVLAKAAIAAGINWDSKKAHGAVYDAQKTAELFCNVMNRWREFKGTPQ